MTKWILLLLLIFPLISNALVDYSEDSISYAASAPKRRIDKKSPVPTVKRKVSRTRSRRSRSAGALGVINLSLTHSAIQAEGEKGGKLSMTKLHSHIQTPYNIFLDVDYWMGSYDNFNYVNSTSMQSGNVNAKLGFNWLQFGSAYDMATIDFYFGGRFRGSESGLAIDRTDKIVGIETAKKFLSFAIGFGYEYTMHGKAENSTEVGVEKTHKLSTALSWRATDDIRFLVEGAFYKTQAGRENIQYSALTPKLDLSLTPLVGLELGGVFRMKKSTGSDLLYSAKLWDFDGAYGNSIFAALRLSI